MCENRRKKGGGEKEEYDNPSICIRSAASRGCPETQEGLPGKEVQVGGWEPQTWGSVPVLSQLLAPNRLQYTSSPPSFTKGFLCARPSAGHVGL